MNGAEITIAVAKKASTSNPEKYFQTYFGAIGKDDGVTVAHTTTTTDAGAPLLLIDMTPEAGNGGDSQSLFYVLGPNGVVAGAVTYADALDPALQAEFAQLAKSVVVK